MIRHFILILSSAVFLTAFAASHADAATIELDLRYVGSYKSDFTTSAGYSLETPVLPGQVASSDVHQFSIYFSVLDLPSSAALQYLAVNLNLGAGLSPATDGNSFPAYGGNALDTFDPPGPPAAAPLFFLNGEAGNQFDLKELTAITNRAQALGLNPGELSAYRMGDFYLNFDGLNSTTIDLVKTPGDVWLYWPDATNPAVNAGSTISSDSFAITVGAVPEPSSIALFVIVGCAAVIPIRRRFSLNVAR